MSVTAGDSIGPYEIKSLLGEGGMGVVFHARDTILQRDVALKLLPEQFANDAERFARFQREAASPRFAESSEHRPDLWHRNLRSIPLPCNGICRGRNAGGPYQAWSHSPRRS